MRQFELVEQVGGINGLAMFIPHRCSSSMLYFGQGNQHKYAYDGETLTLILREAGSSRVIRECFGISLDSEMAPERDLVC